MSLKDLFYVRIAPAKNVWPKAKKVKIQLLASITLMDSSKKGVRYPYALEVGASLILTRVPNPFGYQNPWMLTGGMVYGAAEEWWKWLVETGRANIVEIMEK